MASCVIVGAQWGDEGKGKVVDLFTESSDIVVRFQGGNNAGHTLVVDSGNGPVKTVLHLIPSGILHGSKTCVIASGVVIDVEVFFREIDALHARGVDVSPSRLIVSRDAHVILPYHKAIDIAREKRLGGSAIGTTGRGIGPTYEDRVSRRGVRMRDLVDERRLRERIELVLPERNAMLAWMGCEQIDGEKLIADYLHLGQRVAPYLRDCRTFLHDAIDAGKDMLFEGAQGALLDVGHGTYPFVTSSHTTSGGASVGAGVPPSALDRVVGIAKAYATRVGAGPFPTELNDATGQFLRDQGHEYGSTTGRPRRCGWFDAVAVRAANRLSGFTSLAITKLDVLQGLDEVKICVAYEVDGVRTTVCDPDAYSLEHAVPVYESLPGWKDDIGGARSLEDLPREARALLDRIAEVVGVSVSLVSIGERRDQTIVIDGPFAR